MCFYFFLKRGNTDYKQMCHSVKKMNPNIMLSHSSEYKLILFMEDTHLYNVYVICVERAKKDI